MNYRKAGSWSHCKHLTCELTSSALGGEALIGKSLMLSYLRTTDSQARSLLSCTQRLTCLHRANCGRAGVRVAARGRGRAGHRPAPCSHAPTGQPCRPRILSLGSTHDLLGLGIYQACRQALPKGPAWHRPQLEAGTLLQDSRVAAWPAAWAAGGLRSRHMASLLGSFPSVACADGK